MAIFALIVGIGFAALAVSAVVGLAAAKLYDWITSPREHV